MSHKTFHPWWRHQMKTFSTLLAICAGNSPMNSPHKGQWRGALMFSLIFARINGWVNNGEAGDLRRHRAHHDVTVMHCDSMWHFQFWFISQVSWYNGFRPGRSVQDHQTNRVITRTVLICSLYWLSCGSCQHNKSGIKSLRRHFILCCLSCVINTLRFIITVTS